MFKFQLSSDSSQVIKISLIAALLPTCSSNAYQDLMMVMGIPVRNREHIHGLTQFLDKSPSIDSLQTSSIKSLTGNAMHTAVVGCLVLCMLNSVQRIHNDEAIVVVWTFCVRRLHWLHWTTADQWKFNSQQSTVPIICTVCTSWLYSFTVFQLRYHYHHCYTILLQLAITTTPWQPTTNWHQMCWCWLGQVFLLYAWTHDSYCNLYWPISNITNSICIDSTLTQPDLCSQFFQSVIRQILHLAWHMAWYGAQSESWCELKWPKNNLLLRTGFWTTSQLLAWVAEQ